MANRRLPVHVIDNRGPNSLVANLRQLLRARNCRAVEMQVAFASASGVGEVLPSLRRAASHANVRIVTGLYQGITEPAALWILWRAQQQTKGKIQVRLAKDLRFHRKVYAIQSFRLTYVVCGSSNLTSDGLTSGGECNLLAGLKTGDAESRHLNRQFSSLWSTGSVPVTPSRIKRYAGIRPRKKKSISHRALRSILGVDDTEDGSAQFNRASEAPRYWRDYVGGAATRYTGAIISDETDWDRKRYVWYSSDGDTFDVGDRVMLLSESVWNWAEIVVVKDTTRLRRSTPDGRYFVAVARDPKMRRRRLGRKLWRELAEIGMPLTVEARKKRRKLTTRQWNRIQTLFEK